ncbi:MAG: imidazole glycerol phosphate synthase subunit HisH, partial [Clostridia bacterium]|nr:imidazole glycerol phosphate synthase subunit HisH [Clostridia bacterium]
MIAIVDYGVGNLFSLKSSLDMIGAKAFVTGDAEEIKNADKIILPGVGAFGDAAKKLRDTGLFD